MSEFPIMQPMDRGTGQAIWFRKSIPWEMIAPHEAQAFQNHDQSLQRLAVRGGLRPCEAVAVLEDRRWSSILAHEARAQLEALVEKWLERKGSVL